MTQYELWWADLPRPVGSRPVLLLSRPTAYEYLNKFICALVTRHVRGIPQEVRLGRPEGLLAESVANFDNLVLVPKALLTKRIGRLRESRVREVKRSVGHVFGWEELLLAR